MAQVEYKGRTKNKTDTDANFTNANLTPLRGELLVVEVDEKMMLKVGDGTRAYQELPFLGGSEYVHPSYTPRSSGLYKMSVDALGHIYAVAPVTKEDITALGIPGEDTNTVYTHPSYTPRASGLYKLTVDSTGHISAASAVTKSDITALGIPGEDTNTTYSNFSGASSSAAGGSGLVPAPAAGASNRYLRSDGAWAVPPDTNTTYGVATTSTNGLMSSADKTKLDGIASDANNYVHPSYTSRNSGLYKLTVDSTGHISAVKAVTKADITALGIPGEDTNTTYSNATTSAAGLMSAADKTKLNGIASGANNYTHPTSAGNKHIPSGGSAGQILRWSSSGTAVWGADNNTTYGVATTSANGLMSAADKAKLDGVASGANNYTHPTSAGNKHIPSGGSSKQILEYSSSGTAVWADRGVYSSAERATGMKWIDGKMIYAQTLVLSKSGTSDLMHSFSFSGMDTVWVDAGASFYVFSDNITVHPGCDGSKTFKVLLRRANNQVAVGANGAGTAYVRMMYTK